MKTVLTIFSVLLFGALLFAAGEKYTPKEKKLPFETISMDINLIELSFSNDGTAGFPGIANWPAGSSNSFLWEAGLALSGRVDGELRTSWQVGGLLLNDWQPGNTFYDPNDPEVRFYQVVPGDTFGSQAYVDWGNAVQQGAYFLDLNEDAIYDPFVDRPDILGDKTFWCLFNDVVDTTQQPRRFKSAPLEVEIRQSVWAYQNITDSDLQIIYSRYQIINESHHSIEDAWFSLFADGDIGNFADDLAGCDTSLNLGYLYNHGDDSEYGANPPAFGISVVQGPTVFSQGDTATTYLGDFVEPDTLINTRRLGLSSYMPFNKNSGPLNPPADSTVARLYQLGGFYPDGSSIDPSLLGTGGSAADDARYLYSGDPVSGSGWIDTTPQDRRMLVSMGPFDLAVGDAQDIIVAYVVAQGTSNATESITSLRSLAANAIDIIQNRRIITGIEPAGGDVAQRFQLKQNYPNPFNPSTIIPFTLTARENVQIQVYNTSGQKIATVLDKVMPRGNYEISFSGQNLPSGVYFYRLTAGEYSAARKMVLMR